MSASAAWWQTFDREASIRRGLVLYGNVFDPVPPATGDAYTGLPEAILGRADAGDFTIAARWDPAAGLTFANATHQRRYNTARSAAFAAPTGGETYDMGPIDDPPSIDDGRRLHETLATFRALLGHATERMLLVIEWSHLLTTRPANPDEPERAWLIELGKAMAGVPAGPLDSDRLRRTDGLVVLLAAALGGVPPVLYQGHPRVHLLSVPPPALAERRAFFSRHRDDLRLAAPGDTSSGEAPTARADHEAVQWLAEATDQMTLADLEQLLALSRRGDPLTAQRLLDLYRFGERRSPWEDLSRDKVANVRETLGRRVVGQTRAVDHVATMIARAWLGLAGLQHSARASSPKGTLFFVGPTGVGKTELAKATADFLFGDESACIRFDMSEFNHEHSDQRLVGAPPGYVGFEEGGQLTNAVRSRPFSVLLFDEIEKAHGRVLDKFLQILEDGRLTDGRGETVWFGESVVIFTSNIGAADAPIGNRGTVATTADALADASAGVNADDLIAEHFRHAVERHFVAKLGRPELLNRLGDNIVAFQPIHDQKLRHRILDLKLRPLVEHLRAKWGVAMTIDESAKAWLVVQARHEHGGRGLINAVERHLINPLTWFLFERSHQLRPGRVVRVSIGDDALDFDLTDA